MNSELSKGQFREDTERDRLLLERIASLDLEDNGVFQEVFAIVKNRCHRLDRTTFVERKERVRGKGQVIPPEFDLAFLDQTTLQIYVNTDTVPEEAVEEIIEHEATELVHVLAKTPSGEKPKKETWREAHHEALLREYAKAKEKERLEQHHAWLVSYLETLKRQFHDNLILTQTIDRQIQERTDVYKQLSTSD
ncbi:hypothetical protein EPN81_04780 [Patescibacteria group bacterium]|nr:MAG: hypothetical protein EPN81_04780 [Patescibacteria group bacterium]